MSYASQQSIENTLTRADREAPFALGDGDFDPVPRPSRTPIDWDGLAWTEFDFVTGEIIATGCIAPLPVGEMGP